MFLKANGLGIPVIIPSLNQKDKTLYEGVRNVFINDKMGVLKKFHITK